MKKELKILFGKNNDDTIRNNPGGEQSQVYIQRARGQYVWLGDPREALFYLSWQDTKYVIFNDRISGEDMNK